MKMLFNFPFIEFGIYFSCLSIAFNESFVFSPEMPWLWFQNGRKSILCGIIDPNAFSCLKSFESLLQGETITGELNLNSTIYYLFRRNVSVMHDFSTYHWLIRLPYVFDVRFIAPPGSVTVGATIWREGLIDFQQLVPIIRKDIDINRLSIFLSAPCWKS